MNPIPAELAAGPFTRAQALRLDVTPRMLRGSRFVRVHHCVYRLASAPFGRREMIAAARLAMPQAVYLTGITLLQELGLDFGPRLPLHFVIEGDHHLDLHDVFLHRTVLLPPLEGDAVCVEAAFIAYCRGARVIDAVQVGDWLLHHDHMELSVLVELANAHPWRDGADEALWVSDLLDPDSASLPESQVRIILVLAGLPQPESNKHLDLGGERVAIGDLIYRDPLLTIEYEGTQHQEQRSQYTSDIDRYEVLRRHDHPYYQVTKERLRRPRRLVTNIHAELVRLGFEGPAPVFEHHWRSLFRPISEVLGPRPIGRRSA